MRRLAVGSLQLVALVQSSRYVLVDLLRHDCCDLCPVPIVEPRRLKCSPAHSLLFPCQHFVNNGGAANNTTDTEYTAAAVWSLSDVRDGRVDNSASS